MAKWGFAIGRGWRRGLLAIPGVLVSSAVGATALYVPLDVPGAPPLVTKQVRYRMTGGVTTATATFTTSLRPGDRVTLRGYAINADYVTARYRTKAGELKTRRIAVNQQTNTYSMKVRVLSGSQKVKLQGRRYDGAAGRVVTHRVSPFTSIGSMPFGRSTSIIAVPSAWGTIRNGSLTMTGGSMSTLVSASMFEGAFLTNGGWLFGGGATLQMTGGEIRSKLESHYEGTARVWIGSSEVFNGGFVVRNGGVEVFVDGEWQALEFSDTDVVTIFATPGSYNLGN